ncbi:MAG: formate/nitrite transporter family protein [Asgard group archaeon]|nr:formate/nitrite transporter family protein [Asgard group archaeon]
MVSSYKAVKAPPEIELELETIGTTKSNLSFSSMFVLAILAGVYIGFGGALSTIATHDLAQYVGIGCAKLIGGVVFSIGLILVLLGGAELFTGNNLLVIPLFSHKIRISKVLRNWGIVYIGNFVGAILLVLLVFFSGYWKINSAQVGIKAIEIANGKVNLSFLEAFVRGILCNWLVCLAVWLSIAAKDIIGKIFGILFPITAFVAMGFEHCIANMYFIPLGLLLKNLNSPIYSLDLSGLTWSSFFLNNLLPVTLGNVVGGTFFVGFLYWFAYRKKVKTSAEELKLEQVQSLLETENGIESITEKLEKYSLHTFVNKSEKEAEEEMEEEQKLFPRVESVQKP